MSFRTHGLVVCLYLLLGVIASPSGSTHATLDLETIDPGNIALLEDLSDWVAEEGLAETRQEIKARQSSFEVFRSFHEDEVLYRGLSDLPFGDTIRAAGEQHEVDALLIAAVVEVESHFNPRAVSHRGAVGLMQVLPSTAGKTEEELMDPQENIRSGARYLRGLLDCFEGDLELALAAYNAGPANVRRFGGVPPFRETRRYVEKVLDIYVTHHRQVWLGSEAHDLLFQADPLITDPVVDPSAGESLLAAGPEAGVEPVV